MQKSWAARLLIALNASAVQPPGMDVDNQHLPMDLPFFHSRKMDTQEFVTSERVLNPKPKKLSHSTKNHPPIQQKKLAKQSIQPQPAPTNVDPAANLEVKVEGKIEKEWPDNIPAEFWPPKSGEPPEFNFDRLSEKLNILEFQTIQSHLTALQKDAEEKGYDFSKAPSLFGNNPIADSGSETKAAVSIQNEEPKPTDSNSGSRSISNAVATATESVVSRESTQASVQNEYSNQNSEETKAVELETQYIEAFDPDEQRISAQSEMISLKVLASGKYMQGWRLSLSHLHIPTVDWLDSYSNAVERKEDKVPMISNNSAKLLAALAGVSLKAEQGIAFGKLREGWTIDFVSRPEEMSKLILLDSQFQLILDPAAPGEKYFAIINASAGSNFVYLNSLDKRRSTAVPFPILSGSATYLNLTQIYRRTVSGRVIEVQEDDSTQFPPAMNASVRLVGNPSAASLTDKTGSFYFPDVFTVGTYPVYIETDHGSGFTHRYQFHPDQLNQTTLYRLPSEMIQGWIKQLDGGVHDSSGLIVAATPGMVDQNLDHHLTPNVRSIPASNTLIPETYTLSSKGHLQIQTPLSPYESRFLGVEVAEGPAVAQLFDENRKLVWAELTFMSPNVVNIIGPDL